MKSASVVVIGIVAFASAFTTILIACGGDDAASEDEIKAPERDTGGPDDDAGDPASSSSSGGSSGTSGNPGDGSTKNDGAANDGAASGSSGATPSSIACGASKCSLPAQKCCAGFIVFDAGSPPSCIAANTACSGVEIRCDDTADCPSNQVCCASSAISGSQCQPSCAGVQLCQASNECPNAGACQTFTCSGRTIKACKKPAFGCN